MELTGMGGGIMLAIAALLWLVYLLPNWLKNREYLATEKNAVRLQQTIRVLAETSDVSRTVRADAATRRAANASVATGPVTAARAPRPAPNATGPSVARPGLAAMRLRRTRAAASLVFLASLVTGLVQVTLMVTVGVVIGSWLVLAAAAAGALLAVSVLRRVAAVARARRVPVQRAARRTTLGHGAAVVAQPAPSWTPIAVPKPLYLSRAMVAAEPHADVNRELASAAAEAEQALRDRERPPAVALVVTAPGVIALGVTEPGVAAPGVAGRFSSVGIVDVSTADAPDLNAVLARRRAAG